MAGDGICNDESNILDCNFDFGDCCLVAIDDTMCADCECHTTQSVHPKLSGMYICRFVIKSELGVLTCHCSDNDIAPQLLINICRNIV